MTSESLTNLLTAFGTLAAGVIATWAVIEARRMREAQTSPEVIVYLERVVDMVGLGMESEPRPRKPYPRDVSDDEWVFVAPYLTLMRSNAPQRHHDLREVFNAVRWIARSGAPWRYLPTNFPP